MKNIIVFIVVLFSVGCHDIEEDGCYSSRSTTIEKINKQGLTLKPSDNMYISFKEMGEIYVEVQACIGITAPGPTIEYISFKDRGLGGAWAAYHKSSQTILMNKDEDLIDHNCISDKAAIKHEMVHHVLYMNGWNSSHSSPYFTQCKATGVNTCNGKPCV